MKTSTVAGEEENAGKALPVRVRTVIIGGGAVGASIAYHLSAVRCEADVLLLERDELTSGSTWHAAGNVPTFSSDVGMLRLQKYSTELYARGYGYELLAADEMPHRCPFIETHGVTGALWDPNDGDIDPSQLTQALARGARAAGARVRRFTCATPTTRGTCARRGPGSSSDPASAVPGRTGRTACCPTTSGIAGFPFLGARRIRVAGIEVLALRVSYAGELGWELHVAMGSALALHDALREAGDAHGLGDVGMYAMESMRLEKAYPAWKAELGTERSPFAAGPGRLVALERRQDRGRDRLRGARSPHRARPGARLRAGGCRRGRRCPDRRRVR